MPTLQTRFNRLILNEMVLFARDFKLERNADRSDIRPI